MTRFVRFLWILVAGCSSATSEMATDAAAGGSADDAAIGQDATATDAPVIDTCQPVGDFAVDLPPPPGTDTSRKHALLQLAGSAVHVYASDFYQNGSFFDANLIRFDRGQPGSWQRNTIANGGIGLGVARELAVSSGPDACVAWSNDYDGTLHLKCASTVDRTLAPAVYSSLSLVEHGATKELVYATASALVWQPFDGDVGTAEPIDSGAWEYGPTAIAIDPAGDTHVIYTTYTSNQGKTVLHAVRHAGTWSHETIETDRWSGNPEEGVSVSLVFDGNDPVVAYHHRMTHSLKLARHGTNGWQLRTLVAADPAFSSDDVGLGVALARDCVGRLLIVYQRNLTTDAHPNVGLAYARITDGGLVDRSFLPLTASTAYAYSAAPYSLGFAITPDGHQYVAAELRAIFGSGVYFASR